MRRATALDRIAVTEPKQSLGSIFDAAAESGPRGCDLEYTAIVARESLGDVEGVEVRVPLRLTSRDGVVVDRAVSPFDTADRVLIRLPADSPSPTMLRLRGLGERRSDVAPGDLYLRVEIVGSPLETTGSLIPVAVGLGGFAVVASLIAVASC